MRRIRVASSAVSAAGYDPRSHVMEVRFAGGGVYRYLGVPRVVYGRFLRAPSKGRFLNARIKGHYDYVEV